MLTSRNFWLGVVAGVAAWYLWQRSAAMRSKQG